MNDEEVGLVPAGVDPNEIAMLEARLASAGADLEAAEQIWAELFASQSEFQTRYWTEVGSLVVAIAEAKEELLLLEENREAHRETPDNVDTSDDYADRAAEAQELRDEYKKWAAEEPDPDQPTVPLDEDQERELKDLYKKAAKRWHPDHADPDDDADREWRNDMMIKANELKRVKDINGLRDLLETEQEPEKKGQTGRLNHLIAQLDETVRRRDRLLESITAFRASSWAALQAEFARGEESGVDPWAHLRNELTRELDDLKEQIGAFK